VIFRLTLLIGICLSFLNAGLLDFKRISKIYSSYERGDFKESRDMLVSLKKDNPIYYYNLANSYYKLGRYKLAILYYKRAFGSGVGEPARLHNLGNSYFKLKEYKNAIVAFEVALKIADDSDTRYNLELAKEALKKREEKKEQQKKEKKKKKRNKKEKNGKSKKKNKKKLSKKELKKLEELRRKMQLKEELKKMVHKSFKEKKVPVIMYPLKQSSKNREKPW